jgi:predicted aspartyl protease
MRWIILLSVLWAGQAWATDYHEPSTLAREGLPIGPLQSMVGTVPFGLYHDYLIVVRGSAGGLKGLNFLVDTGASPTVLDPRVARKLHLQETPASIAVIGGHVQAEQATVPSLSLGPAHRENLPVLIQDLSFLEKNLPFRVDGVVGLDVLGQGAFLIDYALHRIQFGPTPMLPNSLALHMKDGLAMVDADVNGAHTTLLVDTGASGLTLFTRKETPALKVTSIGDFKRKQLEARSVRLGQAEFKPESVSLVEGGSNYAFDGLMSPVALGISRVVIDLGRGVMAFGR